MPVMPLAGTLLIHSVDDGHEVKEGDRSLTVQKGAAVFRGHEMFLEHSDYEALKDHPQVSKSFINHPWT